MQAIYLDFFNAKHAERAKQKNAPQAFKNRKLGRREEEEERTKKLPYLPCFHSSCKKTIAPDGAPIFAYPARFAF